MNIVSIVRGLVFKENKDSSSQDYFICESPRPALYSINALALRFLSLTHANLLVPPDIRNYPNLEYLNLSENSLTSPPNLFQNGELKYLNLEGNQLRMAPDVSRNKKLIYIVLTNNRLKVLHCSFQNLSENCSLYVEGNKFQRVYIDRFEEIKKGLDICWNVTPEQFKAIAESEDLREFFIKFDESFSMQDEKTKLFLEVKKNRILHAAVQSEDFHHMLLALASEGQVSCGDRAAFIFMELEMLLELRLKKGEKETKDFCIQIEKFRELKAYGKKFGGNEEIEMILYLITTFCDELKFPITKVEMLYPRSAVLPLKQLGKIRKELSDLSDKELLSRSDYWKQYVEKHHKEHASSTNTKYRQLLERVEHHFKTDEYDPFLEGLFQEAENNQVPKEYDAMARFVAEKRREALAMLQEDGSQEEKRPD